MKKLLLSLVALLSFAGMANADEVTIDVKTTGLENCYASFSKPVGETGLTISGYATNQSNTIGIGKGGGYIGITANTNNVTIDKITVNAKTGSSKITKFDVYKNSTAYSFSGSATITSLDGTLVESKQVSKTEAAYDFTISDKFFAIRNSTSTGQVTISSLVVTYTPAGSPSKQPAGLAYAQEAYSVTGLGQTFKAELTNPNTLPVTYSSSKPEIATVAADGTVTTVAYGETVITATFDGNDTYNSGNAKYTLTVKDPDVIYTNANGKGFTFENPSDIAVWTQDTNYLKGSAYKGGAKAAEAIAASPVIDLTEVTAPQVVLNFDNIINQYRLNGTMISPADFSGYAYVVVKEEGGDWTDLTEITKPTQFAWSPAYANTPVSLTKYEGKKIQFGFKYVSTDQVAGTWEVQNISVTLKHDAKLPAELSFTNGKVEFYESDDWDTYTGQTVINPHDLTVTYSSSNETVADVDPATGEVTVNGEVGEAVITAKTEGNDQYDGGEASYTIVVKVDPLKADNVKATLALTSGDEFIVNYDLTVAFRNGSSVFACDASGDFIQLYGTNNYNTGDIIAKGWTGEYDYYVPKNQTIGTPEIKPVGSFPAATGTATFTPAVKTYADVQETSMVNAVVTLENVVFADATPAGQSNFTGTIDGEEAANFFRNNYKMPSVEAGTYDVTGVVSIYNGKTQLNVIKFVAKTANATVAINGEPVDHNKSFSAGEGRAAHVVFTVPEGYTLWYKFTATAAEAAEGDANAEVNAEGFTKYVGPEVLIVNPGKLEYYTVDNATEAKSAVSFIDILQATTGISDIIADGEEGEATYYNLQGVRVDNPEPGRIYIRVAGGKASKVVK